MRADRLHLRRVLRVVVTLAIGAGLSSVANAQDSRSTDPSSVVDAAPTTAIDASTAADAEGAVDAADAVPGTASEEIVIVPPYKIGAGFLEQFRSSIDDGGRFSVSRVYFAAGASFEFTPDFEMQIGVASEYGHYRFSGGGTFGGGPWRDVLAVGITSRFSFALTERWGVTVGPVVQFTGETGANFSDSIQWGGLGAVRYAFSRDLVVGVGLLVLTQLEDDPLYLPVPLIDWNIGDGWRLSNLRGPEANPFAGIELVKTIDRSWELAGGAAYSTSRFRLDNDGPVPGGVGQENSVPIYGRLTYRPQPWLRIDLVAGVSVLNRLVLDDNNGDRVTASDADPSPLLGIFGSIRF